MSTPLIRVEVARQRDADAIRALPGLGASTLALLPRDLGAPDRCCLVARVAPDADAPVGAGTTVGFVAGAILHDEGHVLDVAVAPAQRGRGIGRLLLSALLDRFEAQGVHATTLEVRPSNGQALALYRQLGFREEGRRPRYYPDGEDALILWRRPEVS
ncbi:MAG: ribosomal protein S18-alanine N-acetyltransferase [Nitriliruptoraceae bacterium]|nr:ribosomal protein S18-alanine N-acetyltransferase [Nitriliruptoraceae bacterium]